MQKWSKNSLGNRATSLDNCVNEKYSRVDSVILLLLDETGSKTVATVVGTFESSKTRSNLGGSAGGPIGGGGGGIMSGPEVSVNKSAKVLIIVVKMSSSPSSVNGSNVVMSNVSKPIVVTTGAEVTKFSSKSIVVASTIVSGKG